MGNSCEIVRQCFCTAKATIRLDLTSLYWDRRLGQLLKCHLTHLGLTHLIEMHFWLLELHEFTCSTLTFDLSHGEEESIFHKCFKILIIAAKNR